MSMDDVVACRACGKLIAIDATMCKHCGSAQYGPRLRSPLLQTLLAIAAFALAIGWQWYARR